VPGGTPTVLPRKETGDVGIAKNAHAIEWLKAEMAAHLGSLFRALVAAKEDAVVKVLAALISCSYLLARRMGVSFARLDSRIDQHLRSNVRNDHQLETWYGDLSALLKYRKEERG